MTPAETARQIDKSRRDVSAHADERVTRQAALATALTSEPQFGGSEQDVRERRSALAAVDRAIALAQERIEALVASLPNPEARAATLANAEALRATADAAVSEFPSRWAAFLASLDAAETAARELARVRSVAESTIANLSASVKANGLAVVVPMRPTPSADAAELARHQTLLLLNIVECGVPEPVVETYLKMFRDRVAAALVPA